MARYKNIRPDGDVLGVKPGETVDIELHPDKERQLIRGRHIKKLRTPKKPKDDK